MSHPSPRSLTSESHSNAFVLVSNRIQPQETFRHGIQKFKCSQMSRSTVVNLEISSLIFPNESFISGKFRSAIGYRPYPTAATNYPEFIDLQSNQEQQYSGLAFSNAKSSAHLSSKVSSQLPRSHSRHRNNVTLLTYERAN